MAKMNGPINIDIEILGAYTPEEIAELMAGISELVEKKLGTKDYSVGLDYGRNN